MLAGHDLLHVGRHKRNLLIGGYGNCASASEARPPARGRLGSERAVKLCRTNDGNSRLGGTRRSSQTVRNGFFVAAHGTIAELSRFLPCQHGRLDKLPKRRFCEHK